MKRPDPRKTLFRISALLMGLALALVLGELTARLQPLSNAGAMMTSPDHADVPGLVSVDPHYGIMVTPGYSGALAFPNASIPLRVNSLGMRGPEPEAQVDPPRWLALGDSFVMGLQVREDETLSARLGQSMGHTVLNGGVFGNDSWDALARHQLISSKVELQGTILVIFTGNDITDNQRGQKRWLPSPPPPLQPTLVVLPLRARVRGWLSQRSLLLAQLRFLRLRLAPRSEVADIIEAQTEPLRMFTQQGAPDLERTLQETRRAVNILAERCETDGQSLVVALAPPLYAVDADRFASTLSYFGMADASPDPDAPQRALLRMLGDDGVAACDLTPALRSAQQRGDEPYLYFDTHWSAAGHAVAAEALASCMTMQGATPTPPG